MHAEASPCQMPNAEHLNRTHSGEILKKTLCARICPDGGIKEVVTLTLAFVLQFRGKAPKYADRKPLPLIWANVPCL